MGTLGIIMLNWNGHEDTIECLESITLNEERRFTIFLLDNGSEEKSVRYIADWLDKNYKQTYKIMDEDEFSFCAELTEFTLYFIKGKKNVGFARGNNLICSKVKDIFDYTLLLNNDTVITKSAISKMVNFMDNNIEVGIVSCDIRLYNEPKRLWNAGGYFTWYGERKYIKQKKIDSYKKSGVEAIKTNFVTGCALMIRKEVLLKFGLFTEKFFFGEEDFNYCKQMEKHNIKVMSLLTSTIYHKVGTSIKKSQRNLNSFVLHFSNRIIDLKEFYSPRIWKFWRIMYICAIFFKVLVLTKQIKKSSKATKYIRKYSKNYEEIDYELFSEINKLN